MNDQIDPKLKAELDALRGVPARDPKLAAQGRAQFLSQAVSLRDQAVSHNPILRLKRWFEQSQLKEKKIMTTFASILAILALLAGGGAGTVYAAQDSLPNDPLYGVKLYSEEFRMNMAGDTAGEFALAMQFAERRGDEIAALMAEGVEPTAENMLQLSQQTQQALQLAGALDEAAMLQAQNMIQNQIQQMLNLQDCESEECTMLMEQTRTRLQTQLMLMDGSGDPDATQEQNQNQGQDQGQGSPNEDAGQQQNQGEGQEQKQPDDLQGQGPADGSGQPDTSPGNGNDGGKGPHN